MHGEKLVERASFGQSDAVGKRTFSENLREEDATREARNYAGNQIENHTGDRTRNPTEDHSGDHTEN